MSGGRPPNLLLLITDQQRAPMHWPEEPGWLDALTPNDAGCGDRREFTPRVLRHRDVLAEPRELPHGHVSLAPWRHADADRGDLWPRRAQPPGRAAPRRGPGGQRRGRARGWRAPSRGLPRPGPRERKRARAPARHPTLATRLRERGYHVAYKGKWHLTKPLDGGEWSAADAERVERDFGFAGWEPPDAGENAKAEHFGGGNAGLTQEGWDEDYTRQVEAFLAQADLPEPFCLVVSLVNPHDVLGYPALLRARAATDAMSSAASACRCHRRSTRPAATSPTSRG